MLLDKIVSNDTIQILTIICIYINESELNEQGMIIYSMNIYYLVETMDFCINTIRDRSKQTMFHIEVQLV